MSPNIVVSLTYLFDPPTRESTPAFFRFLGKLRCFGEGTVLLNCVNMLLRTIHFPCSWRPSANSPVEIFPFIKHSLEFEGRLQVLIEDFTVAFLLEFFYMDVFGKMLNSEQIEWLKTRMRHILDEKGKEASEEFIELYRLLGTK